MENKFDKELNYDVASEEKISKTNEELVKYMKESGEDIAAEQIQFLMDKKNAQDTKPPVKNPINDKLLGINTKILSVLEEIQEDMFDEQDTSIKRIEAKQSKIAFPTKGGKGSGTGEDEKSKGLLDGLLDGLGLGAAAAGSWLANKARNLLPGSKAKPTKNPAKPMAENEPKKDTKKDNKETKKQQADQKKKDADQRKKTQETKKKTETETKKKADTQAKKQAKPAEKPKAAVKKDVPKEAPKKAQAPKTAKPKVKAPKVKAPKVPKKAGAGILKKLLKFTKPVPLLGTIIAAGTAIYSAQDGYRHADEILGKDKSKLTTTDKLASAAGSVVNDVSFGFISTEATANKIIEFASGGPADEVAEKYEKEGILELNTFGDSDVLDWDRLSKLPSQDVAKIIEYDDWDDDDVAKMKAIQSMQEQVEKEISTTETEKTVAPGVTGGLDDAGTPENKPLEVEVNKGDLTQAEPLNQNKEVLAQQQSQSLVMATKSYDTGKATQAASVIVQNSNINKTNATTEKPVQQRLLNMFNA